MTKSTTDLPPFTVLETALKGFKILARNISDLDTFEKDAREQVRQSLATGDFENEEHLNKLSRAQLRVSLCPNRRKQYQQDEAAAKPELARLYSLVDRAWGRFVTEKVNEEYGRFIAAVLPFFDSEREARDTFDIEKIHSCYHMRRAGLTADFQHQIDFGGQVYHAQDLITFIKRKARHYKWAFPGVELKETAVEA